MVSSETYQFVSGDGAQGSEIKGIDKGYLSLPNMAAYYTRSNVQGEVMQTSHLMNPQYSGYADSALHAGNMILVSSAVGQENPLSHHNQLQQQYLGFSTPSSLPQSGQQPILSNLYSSAVVSEPNPQQSSLFMDRFGSNAWAAGNELPFLSSNDTAQITQPLAPRPACMEPGQQQQPNTNLSQLIVGPHQALHDDNGSILQHGISLGLGTDNPEATSPGSNQALSLSLSAQHNPLQIQYYGMQSSETVLNSCQSLLHGASKDVSGDDHAGYSHNWIGDSHHLRTSTHGNHSLGPAFQSGALDSSNMQLQVEPSVEAVSGFRGYLTGSKYLRAAQQLLEEIVSLGCGIKSTPRPSQLQSWMSSNSLLDSSAVKEENMGGEALSSSKGVACVLTTQTMSLGPEQTLAVAVTERKPQESQELQLRKAKLVAMLEEVDRRYKLYFSQMEAVVNTFESAAGLGAAKTYTALALQTISKHFRGLRDAIGGQIRAASRALGEDDSSSLGLGRLRYVDQQLCQQRAFQQLGMMPQHAWRPQRGLPERSVSVLRAWLFEHFLHPYPKDADKHMLARQTGLSRNQVSNWFINARVRLWKPMVEEMYLEELKEAEMDRTSADTSADQQSNTENSDNHRSGICSMDDQHATGATGDAHNQHGRDEVGSMDVGLMQPGKQMIRSLQHMGSNVVQNVSALDGENAHLLQGVIKTRSASGLESYGHAFKPEDYGREEEFGGQEKHGFTVRGMDHRTFGNYHEQGESFATMPSGYGGVSLTLGLQHSDSLSLAGAQQQQYYLQQQQQNSLQSQAASGGLSSQLATSGNRRRLEDVEDYYPSVDGAKSYDAVAELQNRKRFASTNLYHQG